MARILVTGAAGFIGSHTVERAIAGGHDVLALDNFNSYYNPGIKRRNAREVLERSGSRILELDLNECELDGLLDGFEAVIHLAGQPGVRASWDTFETYVRDNISATERLLRASHKAGVRRFVYASSSSVYGNAQSYPVDESFPTVPFSPYGVTKLAGEHLVRAYSANFGLRSVCLRYFTVYGPRQRPDMAFNRLIRSALTNEPFVLNGDGSQIRDFTFVGDAAEANLRSVEVDLDRDAVLNISGGSSVSMADVISMIRQVAGREPNVQQTSAVAGDVFRTGGDSQLAQLLMNWQSKVGIEEGIQRQFSFQRSAMVKDWHT